MKLFDCDLGKILKQDSHIVCSSKFDSPNIIDTTILKPYEMVEWEEKSPIDSEGNVFMNYAANIEHIANEGYERAPTCTELFSFIIDGLDGVLDTKMQNIMENIMMSNGEYLSTAFRFAGGSLYVYDKVFGIVRDDEREEFSIPEDDYWYTGLKIFDMFGMEQRGWNDIEDIAKIQPKLIEYLFTKEFSQLPEELKQRKSGVGIRFPSDDGIYVIARGTLDGKYDINLAYNFDFTSRGVREK